MQCDTMEAVAIVIDVPLNDNKKQNKTTLWYILNHC